MTRRDFVSIAIQVSGAALALLVLGLVLPGDLGQLFKYAAGLCLLAIVGLLILAALAR